MCEIQLLTHKPPHGTPVSFWKCRSAIDTIHYHITTYDKHFPVNMLVYHSKKYILANNTHLPINLNHIPCKFFRNPNSTNETAGHFKNKMFAYAQTAQANTKYKDQTDP